MNNSFENLKQKVNFSYQIKLNYTIKSRAGQYNK